MERRWTVRTKLDVDVGAFCHSGLFIKCKMGDIGLGGVYLSFGDSDLKKGETVELAFELATKQNEECKLRAKVVRLTGQGAGFMFKDFDAIAFRSLQQLMKVPL